MKKFKFLKISKTKKLRYISNYYKKNLYIIFLPGFASDIEGDKPKRFLNYAKKNKLGFLALEYSCLLYTSPSPRDMTGSRMPSSA